MSILLLSLQYILLCAQFNPIQEVMLSMNHVT